MRHLFAANPRPQFCQRHCGRLRVHRWSAVNPHNIPSRSRRSGRVPRNEADRRNRCDPKLPPPEAKAVFPLVERGRDRGPDPIGSLSHHGQVPWFNRPGRRLVLLVMSSPCWPGNFSASTLCPACQSGRDRSRRAIQRPSHLAVGEVFGSTAAESADAISGGSEESAAWTQLALCARAKSVLLRCAA